MRDYVNLQAVLNDEENLNWQGTLFANKQQWRKTPHIARFIYLEGDDELEDIVDDETLQPRLAAENDVQYFLDVQVFKDVIVKQRELNSSSSLEDFIFALNYYREYDSFYWPKK